MAKCKPKLQRLDEIVSGKLLDEGREYLVPTVVGGLGSRPPECEYPILIGPAHQDIEYFSIYALHYHLDPRFFPYRQWREADSEIVVAVRANTPVRYKAMPCLNAGIIVNSISSHAHGFQQMCADFHGAQCAGSRQQGLGVSAQGHLAWQSVRAGRRDHLPRPWPQDRRGNRRG